MEFRINKAFDELRSYSKRDWLYIILTIVVHLSINGYLIYSLEGVRSYEEKLIGSLLLSGICFAIALIVLGALLKRSFLNLILVIVLLTTFEIFIGIQVFSGEVNDPVIIKSSD